MTDRVMKVYDDLLKWTQNHKCCGRRFKRKINRILRMHWWDIDNKESKWEEEK